MFHQSVADRLGLNVTDHKCVDFLILHGPSTAGDLAERTSLTTGAMTAVLDRLEKAGFVERKPDPVDRRKVIVHPVIERVAAIGSLFTDLSTKIEQLTSQYSKSELAVITDFMNRSCDVLHEAAVNLREGQGRASESTSLKQPWKKSAASKPTSIKR